MPKTNEILLSRARSMRKDCSPIEGRLWSQLRNKQLDGVKFARQVVIGPYIADFVARTCKLVIELDGDNHGNQAEYDAKRTAYLTQLGYRVIRFANSDVAGKLNGVLESIALELKTSPLPDPLPKGARET